MANWRVIWGDVGLILYWSIWGLWTVVAVIVACFLKILWALFKLMRVAVWVVLWLQDLYKKNTSPKKRKGSKRRKTGQKHSLRPSSSHLVIKPLSWNTQMCYCPELVKTFENFLHYIEVDETYVKLGRQTAHEVFQFLMENSNGKYQIGRVKVAGSMGKYTGISFDDDEDYKTNPDVDCIVLVNDVLISSHSGHTSPFMRVLDMFVEVLKTHGRIKVNKITNYSIKFTYEHPTEGEIPFDLLPAKNFVVKEVGAGILPEFLPYLQSNRALAELTKLQIKSLKTTRKIDLEYNRRYSSSFTEKTVNFVTKFMEDDDFILDVVLLSKLWGKLSISMCISAKSYIMELTAISAQLKKGVGKTCRISGFKRFLELMSNFGNLKINFRNIQNLPPACLTFFNDYGPSDERWAEALMKRTPGKRMGPVIIDPANPFNNVAIGVPPKAIKIIETQAKLTLIVLDRLKSREGYCSVEDVIDEIFYHKE